MNPELINYCALSGLEQPCTGQVGAVKHVYVIRASDVIHIPDCCNGAHELGEEDPVQVKGGTGFKKYFFLADQCIYTETSRKTAAGTVWEQRVEGFHPGVRPEVAAEICKLKDGHYIVICELYTGKRVLLGSLQNPMQFQSSTTTGRQRRDRNGSEFLFSRQASCPACFINESSELPFQEDGPFAFLAVIKEDNCTPVLVYSVGSLLSDGTVINTATSASLCTLRYAFGPESAPYYVAEIAPGNDATDIASWTYLSGSRSAAQFEDEIVNRIQSPSFGAEWSFFPHYVSQLLFITQLDIFLVVEESGLLSQKVGRVLLTDPTQLLRVSVTGTDPVIIVEVYKDCLIRTSWGDGTIGAEPVSAGSRTTLTHTYSSSGTYDITLSAGSAENIKVLEIPAVDSFNSDPLPNLVELDLEDAQIDSIDLTGFPKLGTFISRGSTLTEVTVPVFQKSTGTPLPMLWEFTVPAAETDALFELSCANGSSFLVEWGDGTIETITQTLSPPFLLTCSHTYTNAVDRVVRVYGSPSSAIWFLMTTYDTKDLLLYYNSALARVVLANCTFSGDKLSLWGAWNEIAIIQVQNCGLEKFDLSGSTSITSVLLQNNNIGSTEMDLIIDQLWQNRAAVSAIFNLTSNPGTPSATSIDKINGTGAYVGEGLNSDYGWTVTY